MAWGGRFGLQASGITDIPNDEYAAWSPYCGPAPDPSELLSRWNLDPFLLAGFFAAAGAWFLWRRRGGQGRDGPFVGAMAIFFVAFVSPLCAASAALFSARVAHHGALVLLAAPLLAFAFPRRKLIGLLSATLLQTAAFWLWHAPGPYAFALSSDAAYWLMQASLTGTAFLFWNALRGEGPLASAGALLLSMVQMGLLGALIAFAPAAVYAPHLLTTWPFGLSPLEDQQAAGLIMWAPMAGLYLLATLAVVGKALGREAAA